MIHGLETLLFFVVLLRRFIFASIVIVLLTIATIGVVSCTAAVAVRRITAAIVISVGIAVGVGATASTVSCGGPRGVSRATVNGSPTGILVSVSRTRTYRWIPAVSGGGVSHSAGPIPTCYIWPKNALEKE